MRNFLKGCNMYPYIDMHCDSLLRTIEQGCESLYNGEGMQSIQKMVEAGQMCQFFAIFFSPSVSEEEEYFKKLRGNLLEQVEIYEKQIAFAYDAEGVKENWNAGRASAVLTIEDGRIVRGEMNKLYKLYEEGVRGITLTWNYSNCFGYPNSEKVLEMQKGLTDFGKEAVEEMNRLGMLIDVSHLSDGGFLDVANISKRPFIASHSNCRALVNHPRNLSDDMIRLLSEKGGVVGINCYPVFAGGRRVENLASHVMHLIQVGGEDCIGIGTDFDGFEGIYCINCPKKMELLFRTLQKRGLSERQLEKLSSKNVLRVMREVL